jgi:hypothetical protein
MDQVRPLDVLRSAANRRRLAHLPENPWPLESAGTTESRG